ncbi:lipid A export permease/ATP-binding protein MsbA [Sutterella sp.]|uniref:lipid A export permease/ATP-binding protein MsbA n=1 Tax=Sutterella sp. TaxID=1981025 RepID=UPI0026010FF2|nr:lipid A export permease/ATP-binding protein MsbA [uncultured Sutterella sp.]
MSLLRRILKNRIDPNLIRLYRYLWAYKWTIALACVFLLGSASMSSLTATLLGKLTDIGFYDKEAWVIFAAPAALIGVSLIFAVSTVMSAVLMTKVSQNVLVKLRTELFSNILRWPADRYQSNPTGLVSSKFVNEAAMALGGATDSLVVLIRDVVQVIALITILFWYSWRLTFVMLLVAPALAFVLTRISRRMRVIVKNSQENLAHVISRVQETYGAERLVKVSNAYDFEDDRFAKVNNLMGRLALKTIKTQSMSTPLTQILVMTAVAFVVGAALYQAQEGLLTFGEFITFLSAMLLMQQPIQNLSGLNGTFAAMSTAAKSIFETLDAEHEKDEGTITLERARGEVKFERVSLRYPGQEGLALSDVSLEVKPGEHVAFVGQSGSGKTTAVNLIPRIWEVSEGRITLDGHDLRDLTLESLRRQISIVSQDVVLFDDTIGANLRYGLADVKEADLWRALETAALADFVKSLPKGLETPVGEGGGLLSGGQKQRLSIARALLKDAPILILDEATSALDAQAEASIKDALEAVTRGRTVFIVAHRYSTIENVDQIVVLEGGVMKERGSMKELLAKENGRFRQLAEAQSAGLAEERRPGASS